jgi:hypothetical protein
MDEELLEQKLNSLIVPTDDIEVNGWYAVLGLRGQEDKQCLPFAGEPFQVVAMNLPFLVAKFAKVPDQPAGTLDTRFLSLMKVSPEYIRAQSPHYEGPHFGR